MLKTLYSQLALTQLIVLCALTALTVYTAGVMIDSDHLVLAIASAVAATFVFVLITGLLLFMMLTRRLRRLADAVDAFRQNNFTSAIRMPVSNPNGDEIDRLGFAFEAMEQRIVDQLQSLQKIDVQRRELLANVSHDLRTPLASMRGYLETLLLKDGSLSREEQRNYLEVAARQSERLGKLVSGLFELTKLDAHEVTPNIEVFSITELIQDVAQKFELAASQKRFASRRISPISCCRCVPTLGSLNVFWKT